MAKPSKVTIELSRNDARDVKRSLTCAILVNRRFAASSRTEAADALREYADHLESLRARLFDA